MCEEKKRGFLFTLAPDKHMARGVAVAQDQTCMLPVSTPICRLHRWEVMLFSDMFKHALQGSESNSQMVEAVAVISHNGPVMSLNQTSTVCQRSNHGHICCQHPGLATLKWQPSDNMTLQMTSYKKNDSNSSALKQSQCLWWNRASHLFYLQTGRNVNLQNVIYFRQWLSLLS